MQFPHPLYKGRLIKRYKRFLADIELEDGQVITAHCANSGALWGVTTPGLPVWVSFNESPSRKLKYTWELVEADQSLIGVNTSWPNFLVQEALQAQIILEVKGYPFVKREVKYNQNSRLDFLLQSPDHPDCYIEVKNVHMKRQPFTAEFPDAVTTRGYKHLHEMMHVVEQGKRAVMLYVVQRNDCDVLQFASDIDAAYAQAAAKAYQQGVEFYAYQCDVSSQAITIKTSLPIRF